MLKSSVSSRGKMYYSKPNRLRWEYTSPYRYQFVMNGQTVTMRNARGTSRADVAQSKVFKEITRIMMSSVRGRVSTTAATLRWHCREVETTGMRC